MADETPSPSDAPEEQADAKMVQRLLDRVDALVRWASASRFRKVLVSSLTILVLVGTLALWSLLARMAVRKEAPVTLEMALAALDNQDFEKAKNLIGRMQQQPNASPSFGGALFVLGAAKAYQAEKEWSVDRQRVMYLVAARYLQRARILGIPPERDSQLQFLLGQSLIRGNQPQAGIDVMKEALKEKSLPTTDIHALLADAYLALPTPNLEAALEHNQDLLADESLDKSRRQAALLTRAEILGRLGRIKEARNQLKEIGRDPDQQARVMNISGQLALAEAQRLPDDRAERATLLEKALAELREAQRLDSLNGELTRQAMYWIGKCYELQGDQAAAIKQYDRIEKLYGDTAESIAATLAKADLARAAGQTDQALAGYRSVLESASDPVTYVNWLLPLSALHERLLNAHAGFVDTEQFEQAMMLVNQFAPIFNQVEVIELRGQTHERWGRAMLVKTSETQGRRTSFGKKSRYHLRAAGRDYESLARLRFATRQFTEDLWHAADDYFHGQSYTHAARILEEYLHHEARRYKALALLRLGQSLLAMNQTDQAVDILVECIEMHPRDAVVYQARIDCQRAYQLLGDREKAEQLLLANLTGDTLTPRSTEWRDSIFALGQLLHDSGRYQAAIDKLEEAVTRYPDAPQALIARYTIARSFHRAAEEPARKARDAKTENERQKNRKQSNEYLAAAMQNYLKVQRKITLSGHGDNRLLERTLLRNCYMMQGYVLFQLKQYEEARKAFANVSTLYQHEPFVLESFVHIANCWRRLNQPMKARGVIEQAKLVLQRLPRDADFKLATNFNRQQWDLILGGMSKW